MSATAQSVKDRVSAANTTHVARLTAKEAGGSAVKQYFEANKKAMAEVLPRHVPPERMLNIAMSAVRKTPALMECTTQSLMSAVLACSQLGLEPNTPLGHAYLVPFNRFDKKKDVWVKDVTAIVGYRGLIDLARRSGQIESISAHAVYEQDHFLFEYGLDEKLIHKPNLDVVDRGKIVAFYAVAKLKDGGRVFEVMSVSQVNQIKDNSEAHKSAVKFKKLDKDPWTNNYEEMGRKTAIRRLSKYLPMSVELALAVRLDEASERGSALKIADDDLIGEYSVEIEDEDETGAPPMETANAAEQAAPDDLFGAEADTGEMDLSEVSLTRRIEQAKDADTVAAVLDIARTANLKAAAIKRIQEAATKRIASL